MVFLSVCLSVAFVSCAETERANAKIISAYGSPIILVFCILLLHKTRKANVEHGQSFPKVQRSFGPRAPPYGPKCWMMLPVDDLPGQTVTGGRCMHYPATGATVYQYQVTRDRHRPRSGCHCLQVPGDARPPTTSICNSVTILEYSSSSAFSYTLLFFQTLNYEIPIYQT